MPAAMSCGGFVTCLSESKTGQAFVRLLNRQPLSVSLPFIDRMATPCRKCGATKTEHVHHGFLYTLARKFGYRLRVCSRCRRRRLLRRGEDPDEPVPPRNARKSAARSPSPVPFSANNGQILQRCPRCGGREFQRTKRRWHERVFFRPPMARCRSCRNRFPLPSF